MESNGFAPHEQLNDEQLSNLDKNNSNYNSEGSSSNEGKVYARRDTPSLAHASLLYSLSTLLLLVVGSRAQRSEFYTGILITEFVLVLGPALLLLSYKKYDLKSTLRLNNVSFMNIFLVFWIMIFAIPLVAVFNYANLWLVKTLFGKVIVAQAPIATSFISLILNILVIGASAGICEEVLFRGVIQKSFEKFGVTKAILAASFLFGLMHLDFQKLFGTFLLGALIGFGVYRTNSLFTGMFAHFTNNAFAVVIAYVTTQLSGISKNMGGAAEPYTADVDLSSVLSGVTKPQIIASLIFLAFIVIFCASAFYGLMNAFIRSTASTAQLHGENRNRRPSGLKGLLWLLPGLITVLAIYLSQGLKLMGTSIQLLDHMIRILMQ